LGQADADLVITAFPMESKDAADQHVKDLREQQDSCGEMTVTVIDVTTELKTTTEDQDIEGAGEATVQESVGTQEGPEDSTFRSGVMSVGNVVVMEEGDQDLGSALSDIAPTFVEGPAEPSEGASESASEEASDSQS
jgi:hypothetical protein